MATLDRELINRLLAKYEPRVREAFEAAIASLRAGADVTALIAALQAGNVNAAIDALRLEPAAFDQLFGEIRLAYSAAGSSVAEIIPVAADVFGRRTLIRFDARNIRAEEWATSSSSDMVTAIVSDQRVAIQNALRAGLEAGQNPRTVALDIVGRIDPATGKRAGGVIGLTAQQESFARSYAAELASGDPAALRNALRRALHDRRFDRTILAAITERKPIDAATRSKMVRLYKERLLKYRGETIARTETLSALHAGKDEALRQAVDSGKVRESAIRRIWRSAKDRRVRDSHRSLNGVVVGLNEVFVSPLTGARLRFPHDPLAPVSERANCRCDEEVRIDFLAGVA